VNRALGIAPNDPEAFQTYARFRLMKAADLAAQAAALRARLWPHAEPPI